MVSNFSEQQKGLDKIVYKSNIIYHNIYLGDGRGI